MNIALDATPLTLTSGGLRRYVEELAPALAREYPEDDYTLLSDQNFTGPSAGNLHSLTRAVPRYWSWGIRKTLRETSVDVFHGTNFEVPYLGRTPAILTIHDLSPWKNPDWHVGASRVRQRTPWLVRFGRAKLILTVSEAMGREIASHFGISAEKIRAVPLAASSLFQPVEVATPPPCPYFLFLGTLEPRKNLGALLEAWQAIRETSGAELWIAGRQRADFVPLPEIPGLRRLGEVSDAELPALYAGALAFVYPTHYEGFGLPVLEAMQCGCPVITSADAAVTEVSGGAALHVSDTRALAEAMSAVSGSEEQRRHLAQAGILRSRSFSWQHTARKTHVVYEEALGK